MERILDGVFEEFESSQEFEFAIPAAMGYVVQALAVRGALLKIEFAEGLREQVGPSEIQSIYWKAEVNGKIVKGEIRLDYSYHRISYYDGWEGMTTTEWDILPAEFLSEEGPAALSK